MGRRIRYIITRGVVVGDDCNRCEISPLKCLSHLRSGECAQDNRQALSG